MSQLTHALMINFESPRTNHGMLLIDVINILNSWMQIGYFAAPAETHSHTDMRCSFFPGAANWLASQLTKTARQCREGEKPCGLETSRPSATEALSGRDAFPSVLSISSGVARNVCQL
jgi:hypothetical protein